MEETKVCTRCGIERHRENFAVIRENVTPGKYEVIRECCCMRCIAEIKAKAMYIGADPELRYLWGRVPGFGRPR